MEQDARHKRKTALITGASSGIGRALCEVFARNGFDLVIVARNVSRLELAADSLRRSHHVEVRVIPADLARMGAARDLFAQVEHSGLEIDALVNNAGMIVYGEFLETDLEDELTMVMVNLVALTELTKLFLPSMKSRGQGWVLNLGSNGSFAPSPLNAVYSATKAYVLSFSEAIAEELSGTGITVTALCPGATRSELQARAGMEQVRLLRRGVLDPMLVAEAGFEALRKGRRVEIPGLSNKLEIAASRFLPRRVVVRYAHRMLQRSD
jgi:short-subunit dehydrogenase